MFGALKPPFVCAVISSAVSQIEMCYLGFLVDDFGFPIFSKLTACANSSVFLTYLNVWAELDFTNSHTATAHKLYCLPLRRPTDTVKIIIIIIYNALSQVLKDA